MSDQVLPTRGPAHVVVRRVVAVLFGLGAAIMAFGTFFWLPMIVSFGASMAAFDGEPVPPEDPAILVYRWALGVGLIFLAVGAVLLWRGSLSRDRSRTGWRHLVVYLASACLVFLVWNMLAPVPGD